MTSSNLVWFPFDRGTTFLLASACRAGKLRLWKSLTHCPELFRNAERPARVEVVDLFLGLGMTADDVFNAYVKKNAVNFQRQETGYLANDELDSKHI